MENPAKGGVSECRTGWLDTPDDTRKIHNPQAATRAEVATTQLLADPRFHRQIEHLHRLGPRVFGELLTEIAAVTGQHVRVVDLVEEYAALDPAILGALGADTFPLMPLEIVR